MNLLALVILLCVLLCENTIEDGLPNSDGLFYYLDGEIEFLESTEGIEVYSVQIRGPRSLYLGCLGSVLIVENYKVVQQVFHEIFTDWSKNYANLNPGEYVFCVRSRIENSDWDNTGSKLEVTSTPPIWQQIEYQLLALLVGMIVAVGIVLLYLRSRQQRRDERHSWMLSVAKLQQQALNLTVNSHFLFNALTSIQHYFNSDQTISRANIYLAKFSKLVRLVLDDSQHEQIPLSGELHRLGLYFELEKMRLGKNFEWFVTVDITHGSDEVKIPVMIIQPYVENAIWHGIYPLNGEGEVHVHVWNESDDVLRMRISDNGLGISRSQQVNKTNGQTYKSRGMMITQQRIDLHVQTGKGKIAVDISELNPYNAERPGTVVDISVGISV